VKKSGEVEFEKLIGAVKNFARQNRDKEMQYIPHPATWINRGQWDDEFSSPAESEALWRMRKSYEETMARRRMQ